MKKSIVFLTLCISLSILSQEKNSLLWKISGNGLQKDSYLYGTMHVSAKVAFLLDDVFFESLLKVDQLALETDPTFWLDNVFNSTEEMKRFSTVHSKSSSDFYDSSFVLKEPKQEEITFFLSREDVLLNGVMFRTNQIMQDFEEDTFLDMFIYQSGKKSGKKIFSLERFKESSALVQKAVAFGKMIKRKPDRWLQKLLKEDSYFTLMNNAYRDRNIQLLDSLNVGMYTENYMKNMLYTRNKNMTVQIDSIVQTGSLFSAIGAAHLGGEKGVIALLRAKGYSVNPLVSSITKKASALKKSIEYKVLKVPFKYQTSKDNFFSVKVPTKLYELNIENITVYLCPDIINGANAVITRISTFSKLYNKAIKNKNFDKFLFEAIPGEIISKTEIIKQGIQGLDIVNLTKTGDYQRYQIFFTPLEILIFKLDGKKNYVKYFGSEFFNSIQFNNLTDELITVSPSHKGFEVQIPKYHSFINKERAGNRLLQAIDKNGNYFFVKEVALNDTEYIEEDAFELKRIQEVFYKKLNLEQSNGNFSDNFKGSLESNVVLRGATFLSLKTFTRGARYYLLGSVYKDKSAKNNFFNSFKITDFVYNKEKFKIQKDTLLHFSTNTFIAPPEENLDEFLIPNSLKKYSAYTKEAAYLSNTNEEIVVSLRKKNNLVSYDSLSLLWQEDYRNISTNDLSSMIASKFRSAKNYEEANNYGLQKTGVQQGLDANGFNYHSYYLKDSLSSKAIKVKHVLSHGAIYDLKTLVDFRQKESAFVTSFYNSFKPKDTLLGASLLVDKVPLFIDALKNRDSLALDNYTFIRFKQKDIGVLMETIKNFEFKGNEMQIKKHLIEELGMFQSEKVELFLKSLYKKSFKNPESQIAIINSVSENKTKKSFSNLLRLLEVDIPLTSSKYKLNDMIERMGDSLILAKNLFPELLNYTTIPEYKSPIYNLLCKILDAKVGTIATYRSYKKQILKEAKIELKRQLGRVESTKSNFYNSSQKDVLSIYIKLLYPFRKERNVKSFYRNLNSIEDATAQASLIILQIEHSENYNSAMFNELLVDLRSRGILYKKLRAINRTDLFPKVLKTKEAVYKAILFNRKQERALKDTIVFLAKKEFLINTIEFEGYFYKSKAHINNIASFDKEWKMNYLIVRKIKNETSLEITASKRSINLDETLAVNYFINMLVDKERLKDRKRVIIKTRNRSTF